MFEGLGFGSLDLFFQPFCLPFQHVTVLEIAAGLRIASTTSANVKWDLPQSHPLIIDMTVPSQTIMQSIMILVQEFILMAHHVSYYSS